jgi:hypothetical protein
MSKIEKGVSILMVSMDSALFVCFKCEICEALKRGEVLARYSDISDALKSLFGMF